MVIDKIAVNQLIDAMGKVAHGSGNLELGLAAVTLAYASVQQMGLDDDDTKKVLVHLIGICRAQGVDRNKIIGPIPGLEGKH